MGGWVGGCSSGGWMSGGWFFGGLVDRWIGG